VWAQNLECQDLFLHALRIRHFTKELCSLCWLMKLFWSNQTRECWCWSASAQSIYWLYHSNVWQHPQLSFTLVPNSNTRIMRPNPVATACNMQYFSTGTAWFLGSFNNHTFEFEELSSASGSSGLNGADISVSFQSSARQSHSNTVI